MFSKPKKTAADLKLMIEEKLRAGHPNCERAEVIISPPTSGRPWSAVLFGEGSTIDRECRSRLDDIVAQLREQFELV